MIELTPPSRREQLMVLGMSLLLAVLFAALAPTAYNFTGDPEHYVTLARRIASGESYTINGNPETRFPPGFPLLLASAAWIFDGSFAALSRWAGVLAAAVFPLTWLYTRRRVGRWSLAIAFLTVGSIPFLLLLADNPMSDPVFIVLTLCVFLWAESGGNREARYTWRWTLTGALLLLTLPAVRAVGVAAVAATGICWLAGMRRQGGAPGAARLRTILPVLAGVAGLVAWAVWAGAHAEGWYAGDAGDTYLAHFLSGDPNVSGAGTVTTVGILLRLGRNVAIQGAHIGEILLPIPWVKPMWYSPIMLVIPILLVGWWQEIRSGAALAATFAVCYLGIVLLWPYDEGARFLLPVVPLLWVYLVRGAARLLDILRENAAVVRRWGLLLCAAGSAGAIAATPESRQDQAAAGFWLLGLLGLLAGFERIRRAMLRERPGLRTWTVPGYVTLFLIASIGLAGPAAYRRAFPPIPLPGVIGSTWIRDHTPADAVILTSFSTRVHFVSGRRTVHLPSSPLPAVHEELRQRFDPGYLLVLDLDPRELRLPDRKRLARLQELYPGRWHLAHEFVGGAIYASK